MSFWDTPTKDIPRQVVMTRRPIATKRPRAARTALTLPGDKMLCVKAGVDAKVFNGQTLHIFVERDPAAQTRIAREINHLDCEWQPRFWRDQIDKLPLRMLLDNESLDFAYLDFCAALNGNVARWIYTELSPALSEGATVAVTLSRNWRSGKYMKWWDTAIKRRGSAAKAIYQAAEQQIYSAECTGMVGDLGEYFDDSSVTASTGYMLPARGTSHWNQLLRPEYHDASVKILSAFTVLLPYHDFELEACVEYRRNPEANTGHWMTTFVLTNFRRRETARVPHSLLKQVGAHVSPTMRPASLGR